MEKRHEFVSWSFKIWKELAHTSTCMFLHIKETTELVFSRLTLTLLHFFSQISLRIVFLAIFQAGCSIPLTLVVVQNPLPQVRMGRDCATANQNPLSRQIPSTVTMPQQSKEAEGLLDPFLLFPPLRYYMICALTHPLPQEVGYLEENRTEVLERQKKREH